MKLLKIVSTVLALTSIGAVAQDRPLRDLRPISRISVNKCAKFERNIFGSRALRGRSLMKAKKAYLGCVRGTTNAKAFERAVQGLSSKDKKILTSLSKKRIYSMDDVNAGDLRALRDLSPKVTTLIKKFLTPNERSAYKGALNSGRVYNWVAAAVVVVYAVEKGFEYYGNSYADHLVYPEVNRGRLLDF